MALFWVNVTLTVEAEDYDAAENLAIDMMEQLEPFDELVDINIDNIEESDGED